MRTHWPITTAAKRLAALLLFIGLGQIMHSQCTLVCNQDLQVSLDPAGQALISTQMIAPNADNSCPGTLELTLFNQLGQFIPNPLNCSNIGQNITARVRHVATGNFCTGSLEVFDAMSPQISCPDVFVFCHENTDPAAVGIPTGTDNCTAPGNLEFFHFDQEFNLGCGVMQSGVPVLKRIARTWTASDEHGNNTSCVQNIWLKHIQLSDLVFPANKDNLSSPALACGQDPSDLQLTGRPSVAGIPVENSIDCEIAVTHSDNIINNCPPASYTVLRTWTAIDFCTSDILTRVQIIKVEDKTAPELTLPDEISFGTDPFDCSATVVLPPATATDSCSAVTVQAHWQFGTGFGPFFGVPLGPHVVTYVATDACGNTASGTLNIFVEDSTPPSAICSSNLQVSLSSSGGAFLNAGTLGINSSDNCGAVFFMASRDAENYSPQVFFDCNDIGQAITVTLKVSDEVGLENYCETIISVRDFLKPNIVCPPATTLNCTQSIDNLSITGQATASDNCSLDTLFYQDNGSLDACNMGTILRIWKAIDSELNQRSCVQNIELIAINSTQVNFPASFTVSNCGSASDLHPDQTGWPSLSGQACSPLSMNFSDEEIGGAPGVCRRIFRHWKVIDHCIYNPNGGSAGIWESTQTIDIQDHTPPFLQVPADVTLNSDTDGCATMVTLPNAEATDCSNILQITHNSLFANAQGANASGIYPVGQTTVTFTATDACGNSASAHLNITVLDKTPPNAQCFLGVTANIGTDGLATLNPVAFNLGSSDNCSADVDLSFSVSPAQFNCQQMGIQSLILTVTDEAGNAASCSTEVNIKDIDFNCGLGLPTFIIDGIIRTPAGNAVRGIPVQISGAGYQETVECDSTGFFEFSEVPQSDSLVLKPHNNGNWLNGLTTFDLLLISKHILGISPLSSPERMIAADDLRYCSV
jgi:hypothetical protein